MPRPPFAPRVPLVATVLLAVITDLSPGRRHKPPKPPPPPAAGAAPLHQRPARQPRAADRLERPDHRRERHPRRRRAAPPTWPTHLKHLNDNTRSLAAGRPDRRLTAASPPPSTTSRRSRCSRRSGWTASAAATTSSTRATRSCAGSWTAVATRSTAAPPPGTGPGTASTSSPPTWSRTAGEPALPPVYHPTRIKASGCLHRRWSPRRPPRSSRPTGIKGLTFQDEVDADRTALEAAPIRRREGPGRARARGRPGHRRPEPGRLRRRPGCRQPHRHGGRRRDRPGPQRPLPPGLHLQGDRPQGQPAPVTQGSSFGRVLTQIDFQVDRKTHDIVRSSVVADNHVVTRTVTPDPTISAFVQTWKDRVAAVANKPIGTITADITERGRAVR